MDTVGLVIILVGIYLMQSAVKNRRPIETAKAVIKTPGSAKAVLASAEGYTPTATGAPSLFYTSGSGSPTDGDSDSGSGDSTLALGKSPLPAGTKMPGGVERGLKPNALSGGRAIHAQFPAIKSMGGLGSRPVGTSDHPRGLAIDFMIPHWNTPAGNAYGWTVAKWVAAHASQLHVKYIIWDKKKWNPAVNTQWRPYTHPSGVNNATLSHRNHVHVSFKG